MRSVLGWMATLVTAAALAGGMSPMALASTATVSPAGSTSFAATTGAKLVWSGKTISCTSTSFGGSLPSSTTGTPPLTLSSAMSLTFSGCQLVGGLPVDFDCDPYDMKVTDPTALFQSFGTLSTIACKFSLHSLPSCFG